MAPILLRRLGIPVSCLVLVPAVWSRPAAGEDLILTLASEAPPGTTWPCTATEVRLSRVDPRHEARPLAEQFVAACDPAVDFQGQTLYFTGRHTSEQAFRIWRLDLTSGETRALTPNGMAVRHPFCLPDGSLAFLSAGDLFSLSADETRMERLTFSGGALRSAAVLPDGRILFLDRSSEAGRLFSVLPDGTWTTLWPGLDGISVLDFAIVDSEHLMVLDDAGSLRVMSIADPYAPATQVPIDLEGTVRSISRRPSSGAFLVVEAGREKGSLTTEVAAVELDPEPSVAWLGDLSSESVLAVHSAVPAPRPDTLPSIVKPESRTGFLFVVDVSRSDDPELSTLSLKEIATVRILELEESGVDTALMVVEPAADGSVFVEAPADTPLAIELLDPRGAVVARSRTPFWVRPNERRGCVGCHVSPAYAPPNLRPAALSREPHRLEMSSEASP